MPKEADHLFDTPLSEADIGHIEARFDAGDLAPAVAHLYVDRLIRELRRARARADFHRNVEPPGPDRLRRLLFNEPTPPPRPREGVWLAGYMCEFAMLEDSHGRWEPHGFGSHLAEFQYGERTIDVTIKLRLDLGTPMNLEALHAANHARKPPILRLMGPIGPEGVPIIDGEVVVQQDQPPPPPRSIAPGAQVLLLDEGGEDDDG